MPSRENSILENSLHLVSSCLGEAIIDGGQDSLKQSELWVEAKEEEHEEKEDGPEPGQGHCGESLGVGDEGEALPALGNLVDGHPSLAGQVAEDGEDDAGGDDGGEEVHGGDEGGVPVDLVVELVVAAKHDEASPGNSEGEEHLTGGIPPNVDLQHLLPLGDEEKQESIQSSRQGDPSNQEGDEDEVGEGGGEVDHLAARLHPLHQAEEDDDPGKGEGKGQLIAPATKIAKSRDALEVTSWPSQTCRRDVEDVFLPELLGTALELVAIDQPSLPIVLGVWGVPRVAPAHVYIAAFRCKCCFSRSSRIFNLKVQHYRLSNI